MSRRLIYTILGLAGLAAGAGLIWKYYVPGKEKVPDAPMPLTSATSVPVIGETAESEVRLPPGVIIKFVDVTAKSGIRFQHFDGRSERDYIMETMGSGLGWLDYDQDGFMDLFIVQSSVFATM